MASYVTKKEVLSLSEPTDLKKSDLEDLYDAEDLFISESGELFVIGCKKLPRSDCVWNFTGPISEYIKKVKDYIEATLHETKKCSLYEHVVEGVASFDEDDLYYYFIDRKANSSEKAEWKKEKTAEIVQKEEDKQSKLINTIRQAQAFGIKLSLDGKLQKAVEKYNQSIKDKYPDISKLMVSIKNNLTTEEKQRHLTVGNRARILRVNEKPKQDNRNDGGSWRREYGGREVLLTEISTGRRFAAIILGKGVTKLGKKDPKTVEGRAAWISEDDLKLVDSNFDINLDFIGWYANNEDNFCPKCSTWFPNRGRCKPSTTEEYECPGCGYLG